MKSLIQRPSDKTSDLHLSSLLSFILIGCGLRSDASALQSVFQVIDRTLSSLCAQQITHFVQLLQQVFHYLITTLTLLILISHLDQFLDNDKTIDALRQSFTELKNLFSAKSVALEPITDMTSAEEEGMAEEEEEE